MYMLEEEQQPVARQTVRTQDAPPLPEAPPGGVLLSLYIYPGYMDVQAGETVNVAQLDFTTPSFLDAATVKSLMDQAAPQIHNAGEELLAYGLWETPPFEVSIPDRVCIPFTDICFFPPGAGASVAIVRQYRVWIMTRPAIAMASARADVQARALIGWVFWIITIFMSVVGITTFLGAPSASVGFKEVADRLNEMFTNITPGEQINKALTGPLIAFGLIVALMGMALAADVKFPVGPATVGIGAGGGSVTGARRRR